MWRRDQVTIESSNARVTFFILEQLDHIEKIFTHGKFRNYTINYSLDYGHED
jgi:hypothetical protein